MDSDAAAVLVLGTGDVESDLSALVQYNNGPARGLYQMEPTTHDDIWINWLNASTRKSIKGIVKTLLIPGFSRTEQLVGNLYYATAMCRLHYRRVPKKLPLADDIEGMAFYHKKYYNTFLGKTEPNKSKVDFRLASNLVLGKGG